MPRDVAIPGMGRNTECHNVVNHHNVALRQSARLGETAQYMSTSAIPRIGMNRTNGLIEQTR
jgi:hypothetical protein